MRQVWKLALAQAFAQSGTIIFITFGGILGTELAPSPALATLPLSLYVIGVALTSLPAAMIMQRIGRRRAFIGSVLVATVAALCCAFSVAVQSFGGFCGTALMFGSNMAFVQQYRFAAADFVGPGQAARAVSTVMLGTLAAAMLWPELGDRLRLIGGWPEFTGSFLAVAFLCLAAGAVLSQLPAMSLTSSRIAVSARPAGKVLGDPRSRVALLGGACSYAVMSFVMTATPISMHMIDGLSVGATKHVISTHLVAMYLPSLFSGGLARRIGTLQIMSLGALCMLVCVGATALVGHQFVHYLGALALLGVGWNFLFVGATTLLATTHASAERFRAQGVNDFAVFGTQALASLLAGPAILHLRWETLNLMTVPLLLVTLAAIAWLARKRP
jgi:predicted MFS family arabinose efflux permease